VRIPNLSLMPGREPLIVDREDGQVYVRAYPRSEKLQPLAGAGSQVADAQLAAGAPLSVHQ